MFCERDMGTYRVSAPEWPGKSFLAYTRPEFNTDGAIKPRVVEGNMRTRLFEFLKLLPCDQDRWLASLLQRAATGWPVELHGA